jgi:GNAT superfamily N-acetyltransferase
MTSTLTFKTLNNEHLSGALRMSRDVSWPHRLEDWAFVAGISNGVVAMEGDRVVATALATPFGPVGTVNMIIVDAALRGRGLGRDIMCRAMDTITPDTWRLVATEDGLPLYEKLGFRVTGEILQHQGAVNAIAATGDAQWAIDDDLVEILALDTATTGMNRHTLYAALATEARFVVLRDDAGISGFAAVRDFGRGEVAGPVIARNLDDAKSLLSLIMAERSGQFLRVDTSAEAGLGPWLTEQGLPQVANGLQMQKGELPQSPSSSHTVFALASQALG